MYMVEDVKPKSKIHLFKCRPELTKQVEYAEYPLHELCTPCCKRLFRHRILIQYSNNL